MGAIKIGMLSRLETIWRVADGLSDCTAPVVLDPVMVATSGDSLLRPDAMAALKALFIPRADLITPNLHEAAMLTNQPVAGNIEDVANQARQLQGEGARSVLIKGGHGVGCECVDVLLTDKGELWEFRYPRIDTKNDHGTGCTLSAAITAELARGNDLLTAIRFAGEYLRSALMAGRDLRIGRGRGPVHYFVGCKR